MQLPAIPPHLGHTEAQYSNTGFDESAVNRYSTNRRDEDLDIGGTWKEVTYDVAGSQYSTLQRESHLNAGESEGMYEAIAPQGAVNGTLPNSTWRSGSMVSDTDTYATSDTYDDVIAVRNLYPYRPPPNGENDIHATLKHKIYRHIGRNDIKTCDQIGIG